MSGTQPDRAGAERSGRTLGGLVRYFLSLGASGFGGPIALVGYMQRDLVEQRQWFTEAEFRQGLAVGQMMPGPLAAQTAMWLGFLEAGARGAAAVAVPFILPPFVIVTAVAILYARYQGLSAVHAVFLGVGPAVLAIIAIAAYKLARSTNKNDPVAWVIAIALCAATAISGAEIVWLFLLAGGFGAIYYGGGIPRRSTAPLAISPIGPLAVVKGLAWTGSGASLGTLSWFFFKAGLFTFGSGLAIVPFLHAGLVDQHHWLTEHQFIDAVAMGLISPGPVVIMATFAGYLAFGLVGAIAATLFVFLPALLLVVIPGPLIRRHENHPRLQASSRVPPRPRRARSPAPRSSSARTSSATTGPSSSPWSPSHCFCRPSARSANPSSSPSPPPWASSPSAKREHGSSSPARHRPQAAPHLRFGPGHDRRGPGPRDEPDGAHRSGFHIARLRPRDAPR